APHRAETFQPLEIRWVEPDGVVDEDVAARMPDDRHPPPQGVRPSSTELPEVFGDEHRLAVGVGLHVDTSLTTSALRRTAPPAPSSVAPLRSRRRRACRAAPSRVS